MKESEVRALAEVIDIFNSQDEEDKQRVNYTEIALVLEDYSLPTSLAGLVAGAAIWWPDIADWIADMLEVKRVDS